MLVFIQKTFCDFIHTTGIAYNRLFWSNHIAIAVRLAVFGQGSGPVLLGGVRCAGTESSLLSCSHTGTSPYQCVNYFDVGVVCPPCK